ncbi:type II toxin-antitoxin system RelE/ParE family toxin [Gaoshiqia sediminis]|uniref:Killer suppression protein HigA n=1 Tax=Gaoshiqia sediminis TaxID=2986998 RepID=A0AA42C9W3_9BACT|nr:hypothetical protein [Gaoshiqia sediminis]MCW0484561.1 hypothetical protein [Gaoshiqia sediminis]
MNITFANKKLKDWANNYALAQKKMGAERAKKYHQRLGDMRDIESFAFIDSLPGRFHQLTGDRNGQWACDLDHPYRLILEPADDPLPRDELGNLILKELRIVDIIEIVDYH